MNEYDNTPIPFTQRHNRLLEKHASKLDDHGRLLIQLVDTQSVQSKELHRLGLLMESNQKDTKIILDVVLSIQGKQQKYDTFDSRIINHEDRISALENYVRE